MVSGEIDRYICCKVGHTMIDHTWIPLSIQGEKVLSKQGVIFSILLCFVYCIGLYSLDTRYKIDLF